MPAWGRIGRPGIATLLIALLATPEARPAAPPAEARAESTPLAPPREQLLRAAQAAEKRGDWEAAFSLYCRLAPTDRGPEARDRIAGCLRKAQQIRRHADPEFRKFVEQLKPSEALSLYAEVVGKLPGLYTARDRATPQRLWEHGVEEFDRALSGPAFRKAYLGEANADAVAAFRVSLREFWVKRPIGDSREARTQLRHLSAAAGDTFAVRVPAAVAVEFLCGAWGGRHSYTVYLSPAARAADAVGVPADLSAYGLYLSFRAGGLWVDGVAPHSWASFHTPLHKGDRILRVNGRLLDATADPRILADALLSPVEGFHEMEIVMPVPDMGGMVRLPVLVPTVYGAELLPAKDGVGYARLGSFRDSTARELDDVVISLKNRGMRSLILDLRGNPGGQFGAGVQVAQRFLPAGIVVTTEGQLGEFAGRVFSSDSGMAAWDVPLVLLVDGETASAAEVVAAALKDHNRATLVGLPTYGKGMIQYPVRLAALDLPDDPGRGKSGSVKVTIARFVSPRGTPINGTGVSPHVLEADPRRQFDLAVERAADLLPTSPTPRPTILMP